MRVELFEQNMQKLNPTPCAIEMMQGYNECNFELF